MVIAKNPLLLDAAKALDEKYDTFVARATIA
jgi:hypothetical protein